MSVLFADDLDLPGQFILQARPVAQIQARRAVLHGPLDLVDLAQEQQGVWPQRCEAGRDYRHV